MNAKLLKSVSNLTRPHAHQSKPGWMSELPNLKKFSKFRLQELVKPQQFPDFQTA